MWHRAITSSLFASGVIFALLVTNAACRTTSASQVSGMKGDGFISVLKLSKAQEQSLYLAMLQVELSAGVKVEKERLHALGGVIECRKDGELESCAYRVRLPADQLSSSQPMAKEMAEQVSSYVQTMRPELASESRTLVDVECSYTGKKSPPYNVEDVSCAVTHPRTWREVVFELRLAEELAELLRGATSYGDQVVTLRGALACQTIQGSSRRACMVRAVHSGVLSETMREVSVAHAPDIANGLWRVYSEVASGGGQKQLRQDAGALPSELISSLVCIVDSVNLKTEGRRRYVCRATLG